jgi:hypothetical protein
MNEHVDREVLRRPAFRRRAAHDLCERRAELLLHEALEGLTRLPDVVDVVDVVALLALTGAVDDQPLRRLVFSETRAFFEQAAAFGESAELLAGLGRGIANLDNRGWSLYGAPWLQPEGGLRFESGRGL